MENEVINNKKGNSKFDIKEFFNKNKKIILIALGFILVVIIALVLVFTMGGSKEDEFKEKLETRMGELAKNFYEKQWYPGLTDPATNKPKSDEEKKEFAARFKDTGLTVDLDSIARIQNNKDEILEEFKNGDKACDVNATKVTIYPVSPYNITDYKVEVTLDCGFEEK